jgi:D-glycero-alpha-D-manno-heptose 1-phosphate guanylyltransferase
MDAIVLAGGLGTRLRGVVADLPKPMAPVHGRPFLAFLLDQLSDGGFKTVTLATGYRHEAIRSYFGQDYRGLTLRYSVEVEPLGTGGAIRLACQDVRAGNVFVLNGDTYLELDFRAMLAVHAGTDAEITIAVCHVPDVARYGALELTDGTVGAFLEKGRSGPGWINAGTYIMAPKLRARLQPRGAFSFERHLLVPEVSRIRPLAFRSSGRFIDIGTPEDYARANSFFRPSE